MSTLVLLIGDLLIFYGALFVALSLRVGAVVSTEFYMQHIASFAILFVVMVFIFYMAGLYGGKFRQSAGNVFNTLLTAILFFSVIAVGLFYFLPVFGLTPKITLTLFIACLFILLFFWHLYIPRLLKLAHPRALLVGGPSMPAGFDIVNIVPSDSNTEVILGAIQGMSNGRVLMSFSDPRVRELLPHLHSLMLSGVMFIDTDMLQEEEYGKVDLSQIDELWFLQYMHKVDNKLFLAAKRVLDIVMAIVLLPVYIVLLPFVVVAIKVEDRGRVFISQERYGRNREVFNLYKFRTMTVDDDGYWHKGSQNVVTKIGRFLRKSRIDELPQLWNVLRGDISLIGPRPDMVKFGQALASQIDYYNTRYIVRPGLTGWAQVSQSVIPQSVSESEERLAYDLYYMKHLSIFLELKIILKTVRLLLTKIFTKG